MDLINQDSSWICELRVLAWRYLYLLATLLIGLSERGRLRQGDDMFQSFWVEKPYYSICTSTVKHRASKRAAKRSINLDVHPLRKFSVLVINIEMAIWCKGQYLFFFSWCAPVRWGLNTDKDLDFDLWEIRTLWLHNAFFSLLDSPLIVEGPILEMLVPCSYEKCAWTSKNHGIDRFSQLIWSDSLLKSPIPYE